MIAECGPGMPSGLHCQSPAMRGSSFCYFHARPQRPARQQRHSEPPPPNHAGPCRRPYRRPPRRCPPLRYPDVLRPLATDSVLGALVLEPRPGFRIHLSFGGRMVPSATHNRPLRCSLEFADGCRFPNSFLFNDARSAADRQPRARHSRSARLHHRPLQLQMRLLPHG